ncbi:MAG: serine--tRNA ligase [Methanobacteriaceae archaeon]|jgi:seryl-tRNA synthetase|nr:serine--tRNA ligase [Methanobacteriaceae archaeon]
MKFTLQGEITFSKDAAEARKDIAEFIEQANTDLFLKGVPQDSLDDASKIVDWNLEGNSLKVEIVSGRRGRAHDALLRMKKPLGQLLGKKYHLGVRKIHVNTYKIDISLPGEPEADEDTGTIRKGEIDLGATVIDKILDMPYVSSSELTENKLRVEFEELNESQLKKHVVDRVLKFIKESVKTGPAGTESTVEVTKPSDELTKLVTKIEPGTIVSTSPQQEFYFKGDATEEAAKRGWVKKFPGKGQWFYGPKLISLQRAMEEIFLEKLIYKLDFAECMWPKLIPIPVMNKMRYLEGLPEGMYYCSAPRRDPEVFDKFRQELAINKEVPIHRLKEGLKDPSYVLAPAQCEPFYEFFSHEVIDEEELPVKFFDRSGWTYRWEAGGAKGLDRVHEFQRAEMVWMGTPEQVEELRDTTLHISEDLATEMELEWYTEVGDDPFYLEGRKTEERGIEFPDVPKYEMRLVAPTQDKGVAVVSANIHGTHFIEGFSIKEAHGHRIWTGCTGIGISRWIFGFLAQKGFDDENWPDEVTSKMRKVHMPKVLTWP